MLVAKKINKFIMSRKPVAVCDGCIVDALGLAQNAHSAQITAALGTTSDFVREKGECSICKNWKTIIYAKGS